ncbi:MAG: hypothetical protein IJE43_02285 [Alphaproteobacteria bacterium]|nr:hypothetical protein [Alphaproteobacteria bacterium]
MSRTGLKANFQTPDARCLGCKYWVKASKTGGFIIGTPGRCGLSYCKKDSFKKKGSTRV